MPDSYVPALIKRQVIERARERCEYCCSPAEFATQSFAIEHIKPRVLGGETQLSNLALACEGCNSYKGIRTQGRDPLTSATVPLFHPRQHKWHEHFRWSDDYTLVVGLTPTGRITVETLRLNRHGLVNLRRVLYTVGEHPPKDDGSTG